MKDVEWHYNKHAEELYKIGISVPNRAVFGRQLETGDVLEEDDVYDSSNGSWERCTCPGLTLQEGTATVWVRPG